jgi:hypothetical protein
MTVLGLLAKKGADLAVVLATNRSFQIFTVLDE